MAISNDDLQTQLNSINSRLDKLEASLGKYTPAPQSPSTSPVIIHETQITTSEPKKISDLKTKSKSFFGSSNLLAVTATICFILASSFTVKLALDSGWLTPFRQLGLSFGLGAVLCTLGRYLKSIDIDYRSYLSGAGCIILFLVSYASSLFFEAVPPFYSILMTLGSAGITLSLYHFHKNDLFAFIATVGTFICPLIFETQLNDPSLLSFYFLTWAAVFSYFSVTLRSRTLSLLSCYLGLGVYASLNSLSSFSPITDMLLVLGTLFAQFFAFAGGVFQYSTKHKSPLSNRDTWLFFPALCFFYGITFNYVGILGSTISIPFLAKHLDSFYGLIFGLIVYAFYFKAKTRLKEIHALNSQSMIQAFLCITVFHSGYLTLLPHGARTWLLPLSILGYYIVNQKNLRLQAPVKLLFSVMAFFEWLSLLQDLLLQSTTNWNKVLSAAAVIVLGALYYLKPNQNSSKNQSIFLWGLHMIAISLIYKLSSGSGSFAVSGVWGLYAVLVLSYGYVKREVMLAKSSTLILLAVAGKALIYDASQAASGLRIACLLLTGVVLYGSGYLFKKMSAWKESQ